LCVQSHSGSVISDDLQLAQCAKHKVDPYTHDKDPKGQFQIGTWEMIRQDRTQPAPYKQGGRDNDCGFQIDLPITIIFQNSGKSHRGEQNGKARADRGMLRKSGQIDEGGNDEHASADPKQAGSDSGEESNEQQENR
jgi:hypothetical protein